MGQHISQLVQNLFLRYDNWQFTLIKSWPSIFGPLSQHTRLERIDGTTLIIGVYDPHWMQELHLLSRTFIDSVNAHVQKQVVTAVRFKFVQRTTHPKTPVEKNTELHQDTVPKARLLAHHQQALTGIKDPELKAALIHYFEHIRKGTRS